MALVIAVFKQYQFQSTAPAGTPPLVVASSTVVANLNADLLDGKHASEFAAASHPHAWADVSKVGSSLADLATRSASDLSSGTLPSGRLAGAYTGVTEVGTLTTLTVAGAVTLTDVTFGATVGAQKLRLFEAGTSRYGFGIVGGEMRAFVGQDQMHTWGEINSVDGTTYIERMRLYRGILALGTTVTTGAAAGDLVLANTKSLRAITAAGTVTVPLLSLDSTDRTVLAMNNKPLVIAGRASSASVSGGAAQALPPLPAAYITISFDGALFSIPVYNHVS